MTTISGTTTRTFDPRTEVPALLDEINEIAPIFRDVFEGNTSTGGYEAEALELRTASERLRLVCWALTATTLVCAS